jgi:hypothetical protein
MNLAIGVALSNKVRPLVAVVSPLSYHVFPTRFNTVILVPAGNGSVKRKYAEVPFTENSASCVSSAAGLAAPLSSIQPAKGSLRSVRPSANT